MKNCVDMSENNDYGFQVTCTYIPNIACIDKCFGSIKYSNTNDLALYFVQILNEINASILESIIDKRKSDGAKQPCSTIDIDLKIDKNQNSYFFSLLKAIADYREQNPCFDASVKSIIVKHKGEYKPILDEYQTDDTGKNPIHRKINLDNDLQPYRDILFFRLVEQ